jgi:medium-chain acyl-[acyl-carrier-protein] hydrolase
VRVLGRNSTWLTSFGDVPDLACELVCFPHAGGGGSVFRDWQRHTTALRISAVRLPGRELRLREPAFTRLDGLVDALAAGLAPVTGGRYAFYGHSMGALVAFELARRWRAAGAPLPAGLFVAGCDAPHLLDVDRAHDLPRDQLIAWLSGGNGLDPEALRYPGLIDLMLPTIRADLAVVETYRYRPQPPLPVPIHVFRGIDDVQAHPEGSTGWAEQTSSSCTVTELDGGHFFVLEHVRRIVSLIEADLVGEGAAR